MSELQRLKKNLDALIETRTIKVASGNVPDYPSYRQLVGELIGLALVNREIDDIRQKHQDEDEDI